MRFQPIPACDPPGTISVKHARYPRAHVSIGLTFGGVVHHILDDFPIPTVALRRLAAGKSLLTWKGDKSGKKNL
jgi:hypothetical protein